MLTVIKETILQPLVRRLGTFVGAYLIGVGVHNDSVNTIVAGMTAAVLVGVDLIMSNRTLVQKSGQ